MMKKVKDMTTNFTLVITENKLKIEMPIVDIIRIFEDSPNNIDDRKIKRGMKKQFMEWLVKNLLDDADVDTGANFIIMMLENVFDRLFEEYDADFLDIKEEEEGED